MLKLEEGATDKLLVNHGGLDIDFQVKGENSANLIRTDAENDSIYFGANSGAGDDNNFWVSGSVGSQGSTTRGTAVFGGDTVISGTTYLSNIALISDPGNTNSKIYHHPKHPTISVTYQFHKYQVLIFQN